ncbi:MAG: flagellar biosynthesis anti-sigma factor FlgM [Gammaproteobacteria bacterium]|nr:flagellar biosynthesis anti-sigma factor FlgM [Gammaproteobacteria bacterium]
MTNRIGPVDQGAINKVGNKVEDAAKSQKTGSNAPASGTPAQSQAPTNDTVELTSGAKLLERLEKTLAASPSVDSAKVAEVKAAIENGEYQIDTDAIAEAMIRLERSLGE